MLKTRYKFLKRLYPDTMIIFKKRNNICIYSEDALIIKYFRKEKTLSFLEERNINYIIIDNMDIIKYQEYDNNNYNIIYKKYIILKCFLKVLRKSKKS